jgi:hypothetical protein
MQNLFEMSYFRDARNSDGAVATGWSTIEDHKQFNTLSSRLPESDSPADQDGAGADGWDHGNSPDDGSGSDETPETAQSVTRMNEESSDEEPVSYKVSMTGFL